MDISYDSNTTANGWNNFDSSIYHDSYYAELEKRILLLMGDDEEEDEHIPQQPIGETIQDSNMPISTGQTLWPDRVGYRKVLEPIPNLQPKPKPENGNGTGVFIPLPVQRTVHSGRANRQRRRTYKRTVTA